MVETEPQGRIARVEFTGTRSELFGLLVRGYILMVPTIGIYRFWLTTWKRRFYWQHTVLDGEPLEYTGNALQLLIGFLFALAFFLPLYLAFFYLSTQNAEIVALGYGIIGALFWFMIGYALYKARDFRLSRTLWRGIRFNQHGNAWAYALRRFLWSIAVVLTLGLLYPAMAASLWRYRYNHTWYGDRQFRWTGSWKTIAGPYYLIYFGLIAAAIGVVLLAAAESSELRFFYGPGPAAVLGIIGWFLLAFLAWFYFRSREATRMFSEVWIGTARATVKVRARALLGQFILYALSLIGVTIVISIVTGMVAGALFSGAITNPEGAGDIAVAIANIAQSGWLAIAGLILGYLVVIGAFALMGEVFLGYGYWMLVARGATISDADSLRTVHATGEDLQLTGEGLADALNVGAY